MPGTGRPGDPLWMAIGFASGVIPGIWFHQVYAGLGIGMALAIAFGRIREDKRRLYRRPTDPTRFMIGLGIGLLGGAWLHSLGLGWSLGMGLGLAFGLFLGAALGVSRALNR